MPRVGMRRNSATNVEPSAAVVLSSIAWSAVYVVRSLGSKTLRGQKRIGLKKAKPMIVEAAARSRRRLWMVVWSDCNQALTLVLRVSISFLIPFDEFSLFRNCPVAVWSSLIMGVARVLMKLVVPGTGFGGWCVSSMSSGVVSSALGSSVSSGVVSAALGSFVNHPFRFCIMFLVMIKAAIPWGVSKSHLIRRSQKLLVSQINRCCMYWPRI